LVVAGTFSVIIALAVSGKFNGGDSSNGRGGGGGGDDGAGLLLMMGMMG